VPDWIWITALIVLGVGFFTDFYGLGTMWTNRGSWYTVEADQLPIVMQKLFDLHTFDDSDGLLSGHVKIKVSAESYAGDMCYQVKVPTRVFKYLKVDMTETAKLQALGLHP
jgi:hypothetical protein